MLVRQQTDTQYENKVIAVAATSGSLFAISVVALATFLGMHLQIGIIGYSVMLSVGFSSFVIFSVSFYAYNRKKGVSIAVVNVPIAAFRKREQPVLPLRNSGSDKKLLNVAHAPLQKEAEKAHPPKNNEEVRPESIKRREPEQQHLINDMNIGQSQDLSQEEATDSSSSDEEDALDPDLLQTLEELSAALEQGEVPQDNDEATKIDSSSSDEEEAVTLDLPEEIPVVQQGSELVEKEEHSNKDQVPSKENVAAILSADKQQGDVLGLLPKPVGQSTAPIPPISHPKKKEIRHYKEDPVGPPVEKEKIKGEDPIQVMSPPLDAPPVEYQEYMTNFYVQLSHAIDNAEEAAIAFVSAYKKTEGKRANDEAKKIRESFATFKGLLRSFFLTEGSDDKLFRLVFTLCSSIFTQGAQRLVESSDIELAIENLYRLAKERNGFMRPFLQTLYSEQFETHREKINQTNFTEAPFQYLQHFNEAYQKLAENPFDVSQQIRCIQSWARFVQTIAKEAKFDQKEMKTWQEHFFVSEPFSPILLAFNNTHGTFNSLQWNYIEAVLPLIKDLEGRVSDEDKSSPLSNALYRLKKGKFSSNIPKKLTEIKDVLKLLIEAPDDESLQTELSNRWTEFLKLIARDADLSDNQVNALKETYALESIVKLVEQMDSSLFPQPSELNDQHLSEPRELCIICCGYTSTVASDKLTPLIANYHKAYSNWRPKPWGETEQNEYLNAWTALIQLFAIGLAKDQEAFLKRASLMNEPLQRCSTVVASVLYLKNNYFLRPFFKRLDIEESESLRRKIDQTTFSLPTIRLLQHFKAAATAWEKKRGDLKLQTACIALWDQFLTAVAVEASFDERENGLWRAGLQDLCWTSEKGTIKIQPFVPCFLDNHAATFLEEVEVDFDSVELNHFLRSLKLHKSQLGSFVNTLLKALPQEAIASLLALIKNAPLTKGTLKYVEEVKKAVIASRKDPENGSHIRKIEEAWIVLLQHLVFTSSSRPSENPLNRQMVQPFLQALSTLLCGDGFSKIVNTILDRIGSQYRQGGKFNEQFLEQIINGVVENGLSALPSLIKQGINSAVKAGVTSPSVINNLLGIAFFPYVIKPAIESVVTPILSSSKEFDLVLDAVKNILYVLVEPILKATFKTDRFRAHFQGILSTPYLRLKPQMQPEVSWSNLLDPCVTLLKKATETLAVGELFVKIRSLRENMQKQLDALPAPSGGRDKKSVTITCLKDGNSVEYSIFEHNLTSYLSGLKAIEKEVPTIDLTEKEDLPEYTYVILQYLADRQLEIASLDLVLLLQAATYFDVKKLMIKAQQLIIDRLLQTEESEENEHFLAALAEANIRLESNCFEDLCSKGWYFLADFIQVFNGVIANQELEKALAETDPPKKAQRSMTRYKESNLSNPNSLPESFMTTLSKKEAPPQTRQVLLYLTGQLSEETISDYKPEKIYQLMVAAKFHNVLRLQLLGQRLLIDHFLNNTHSKYNLHQIVDHGWTYLARVLKSYEFRENKNNL